MENTKEYIQSHIDSVRAKMYKIVNELSDRAKYHDSSKLEEPEYSFWKKMDEEPKYPYGSEEYKDKMNRYARVFRMHYMKNRHHPEHFINGILDMNLVDLAEMLCDWLSYKKYYSIKEVIDLMGRQCARFGYGEGVRALLTNTALEYFVSLGGITNDGLEDDVFSMYSDNKYEKIIERHRDEAMSHIDILV